MKKVSTKTVKPEGKEWNKYVEELKKETIECITENQVP
jgi:hypothetical protein